MTLRERLRAWLGRDAAAPGPTGAPVEKGGEEPRTEQPEVEKENDEEGPEAKLKALARGQGPVDEDRALELVAALCATGNEARALVVGREVLGRRADTHRLAYRLADLAASRGEDAVAETLLAPVLAAREPALAALVLGGELAERRADVDRALALYERALARDVDLPGAKERAARLRDARGSRREPASATLLVDGALARGRWRVLRELGRGGAGTVFLARDVRLGRDLALKVYHARGPLDHERLRAEARVPASLPHAGVIRVVELDDRLAAIAMEHLPAGSLRDLLRRAPLRSEVATALLRTLVEALAFVHVRGVVHRDLKPSNILLREVAGGPPRAVLSDFGLARRAGEDAPGAAGEGTLAFMAPEQRAASVASPAMDVYALGMTMREVLARVAGDPPAALLALAAACSVRDPVARPSLIEVARVLGA